MRNLHDYTNEQIRYKNFSEEVRLIKETKAGASYSKYTCTNKNGITFHEVPGLVGLTGAAVMGYVNGDRARPVIIGPATKPTVVYSSFGEGWFGDRAIFAGGAGGAGTTAAIEYASIPTLSNTSNFGNLLSATSHKGACSSRVRAVFAGSGSIEYITVATLGNSASFGSLLGSRNPMSGCGNGIRGVFADVIAGAISNMEYVLLATLGSSTNFGNMINNVEARGACSNGSRGIFWGGSYDTGTPKYAVTSIEYINIASTGNSANFGDLSDYARDAGAAIGNATYGIFAGGNRQAPTYSAPNTFSLISVVSIASSGNSTSFGSLSTAKAWPAGAHNATRALFAGGVEAGFYASIEYIAIAASGTSANFGNLSTAKQGCAGTSGD